MRQHSSSRWLCFCAAVDCQYRATTPGNVGPQEVASVVFGAQSAVGAAPGMLASGLFRVGDILVLTAGSLALGVLEVLRSGASSEVARSSNESH